MRSIGLPLCGVLLVVGAVVHGATTHRWSALRPGIERRDRLQNYAVETGDYQVEMIPNDQPLKEKSIATSRRYFSPTRNLNAVITMITGPAGSVTTHTPDVCYTASGYKLIRAVSRETIDLPGGTKASYYVADFEKTTTTTTERQRVRWTWSNDGQWKAPDHPRLSYLDLADIAKLYIVTPIQADEPKEDSLAVRQFVTAALVQYAGLFTNP